MKTEALRPSLPAQSEGHAFPVAVICLVILVAWYIAAIPMNWVVTQSKIAAAGGGAADILYYSWNEQRPVIPAPQSDHRGTVECRLHGQALGR